MVIANSDSTGTLVSLGNGLKRVPSYQGFEISSYQEVVDYQQTELLLPEDIFAGECLDDGYSSGCSSETEQPQQSQQPLYLPKKLEAVDECLKSNMLVMERCDELLAQNPVLYNRHSQQRILYVAQGEVAHAVPSQCDVLVSDKATTCHILAFQSCSGSKATPLTSLTHIDSISYEKSVRAMIQEHKEHHYCQTTTERISLDIHIVGGFQDSKGSSREISNWLISLLASIATEEKDSLKMTLQTCAVSSMNDNGHSAPIGRGLAINTKTGESYLAQCAQDVAGPQTTLRSLRLWSGNPPKLHLIHTARSNEFRIEAFSYTPFKDLDALLQLPDHILLKYTSTSPDCEEDDFCQSLRLTLAFLRNVPATKTFGAHTNQPLVYRRVGHSNAWQSTTTC